jgi:cell division septation protein DedD
MQELVRLGRKETVSEWDIRPVGLAFALGVYPSRVEAEAFEDRLAQQRIPAYTLPVEADGDSAFQVYAGGFESAAAADALGAQLEDSGWEAELIPRRGVER